MKLRIGLLGILGFGCMANRGAVEPYSYAPKSSSSMYQLSLDLTLPKLEDRVEPVTLAELVDFLTNSSMSYEIPQVIDIKQLNKNYKICQSVLNKR